MSLLWLLGLEACPASRWRLGLLSDSHMGQGWGREGSTLVVFSLDGPPLKHCRSSLSFLSPFPCDYAAHVLKVLLMSAGNIPEASVVAVPANDDGAAATATPEIPTAAMAYQVVYQGPYAEDPYAGHYAMQTHPFMLGAARIAPEQQTTHIIGDPNSDDFVIMYNQPPPPGEGHRTWADPRGGAIMARMQ
jgi:hypothetical protein